jgi:hypothetical protein
MKIKLLFLLLLTAMPAFATNWYIRADGGIRGRSGVAATADGLADAPCTTGVTHCAFNEFQYLYNDASYNGVAAGWLIGAGDIVNVRDCQNDDGTLGCRIGELNSSESPKWCVGAVSNAACSAGPMPANVTIRGYNYASCSANGLVDRTKVTEIFGGGGVGTVLNLSGANGVLIECIALDRHSGCQLKGLPAFTTSCTTTDDTSTDGVVTNINTINVTMQDMYIHGFPDRAVIGPIGGAFTCLRCDLFFNSFTGWDFDDGTGGGVTPGTGSPNGTWSFLYSRIVGSGCYEEYPIVHTAFPAAGCYGQSNQGQGDGVGTPAGFCMNVYIDHSVFSWNVQDGLDLGHLDTLASGQTSCILSVTNSAADANEGGTFKWAAGPTDVTFVNNFAGGRCTRMMAPIAGASSTYNANLGDFCRSSGDNWSFNFYATSHLLMANNTTVTYNPTTYDVKCVDPGSGSNPCAAGSWIFRNNITLGYSNPNTNNFGGKGPPGAICETACNDTPNPPPVIVQDHNIWYGMNGYTPPSGDITASPMLVSQPTGNDGTFVESQLDNPTNLYLPMNFNLATGSPAIGAGATYTGIPSTDSAGNAQTVPPVIGALVQGGTPPAATLVSIALTPNPFTQTVGGATTTLTCTATMSDSSTTTCASQGTVTWTSSVTSVATVASGMVTAVGPGVSNITATVAGITSPADVDTVSETMPFTFMVNGKVILSGRVVVQ